jgi:hypothetical protein
MVGLAAHAVALEWFPPPLAGEGQGGGTHQDSCQPAPSPTLPRKRGRERTELAAR